MEDKTRSIAPRSDRLEILLARSSCLKSIKMAHTSLKQQLQLMVYAFNVADSVRLADA